MPDPSHPTAFDLPDRLRAKTDPLLIAEDERHFAAIEAALTRALAELDDRIEQTRRRPTDVDDGGQSALERDLEVHRLGARRRALGRYRLDLCLGRMVTPSETVYVGRFGLVDPDGAGGRRLLVDWRSPAAEPFFAATHARPCGLVSRRRYRWSGGRVVDYWDELFTPEALDGADGRAALDDQSAFIASLGASRSAQMRDVLGTIQADQDAIIRAASRGALVVDGGPGTGKTVVALHRAAYLSYADPRLGEGSGGFLVVGPSRSYLAYVADVLPGLGEESVQTCTLPDLVPQGAQAGPEPDPRVAAIKAEARLVEAIEAAVALYEEPPTQPLLVETPWADVRVEPAHWSEAFAAPEPGTPHNDARDVAWEALLDLLVGGIDPPPEEDEELFDAYDREAADPRAPLRHALATNATLVEAFSRAWTVLSPEDVVGDLWSVPAYLRHCAPWLEEDQRALLRRRDPQVWTTSDLPFLDAARRRLGDAEAGRRRRARARAEQVERARMHEVIDDLIATDDSDLRVLSMLRGQDLRTALVDREVVDQTEPDRLAGPFAHLVVDEAQELSDAEWQMLLVRCPSRSLTIVGDRAQARSGFTESWHERLARVGLDQVQVARLTINYRTPGPIMAAAAPVIRAALPDAAVPTSIRTVGEPVGYGTPDQLDGVLADWLAEHPDGTACVIALDTDLVGLPPRVRALTPVEAKGLEFDLVVVVEPDAFGAGITGAVDRYVAMTRATGRLVVLAAGGVGRC